MRRSIECRSDKTFAKLIGKQSIDMLPEARDLKETCEGWVMGSEGAAAGGITWTDDAKTAPAKAAVTKSCGELAAVVVKAGGLGTPMFEPSNEPQ